MMIEKFEIKLEFEVDTILNHESVHDFIQDFIEALQTEFISVSSYPIIFLKQIKDKNK